MPAFVIMESAGRIGETVDATMFAPNVAGFPDRRTGVPVKATISEKALTIDDEPCPRSIISCAGKNGTTTYLVDGSSQAVRNRERRATLAKASTLLQQLTYCLEPLAAESDDPALAMEGLGMLFDWLHVELATTALRSRGADGGHDTQ
jgi:hypothetical protein